MVAEDYTGKKYHPKDLQSTSDVVDLLWEVDGRECDLTKDGISFLLTKYGKDTLYDEIHKHDPDFPDRTIVIREPALGPLRTGAVDRDYFYRKYANVPIATIPGSPMKWFFSNIASDEHLNDFLEVHKRGQMVLTEKGKEVFREFFGLEGPGALLDAKEKYLPIVKKMTVKEWFEGYNPLEVDNA